MATIRLQGISKTYTGSAALDRMVRVSSGSQTDRAFAERVVAKAAQEQDLSEHPDVLVALDQVDLTVPNGQTCAIVGPSGCGKTTLLRIVAGLETDYVGQVFFDGQDMRDVRPGNRYIGMVFQNYALYPHFEGRGNLSFFFKMHKVSDKETEERIRVTAEMMGFGFDELLKRRPGVLSGGQQQRLAIARALVRKPRLFLFDEPLSNLDAKTRSQTRVEIKRLLRQFQITCIYVTHDQQEAISLGDRIAVMRAGRIEQLGVYHELRRNPHNAFVASFLGSPPMNLLAGEIVEGALRLGDVTVALPARVKPRVHSRQAVILGIRPEVTHLSLGGEQEPEGIRLPGVVEMVESDFDHRTQLIYVRAGSCTFSATGSLDTPVNAEEVVEVVLPVDQLYFFDAEREWRIG